VSGLTFRVIVVRVVDALAELAPQAGTGHGSACVARC
jgi:hypothetical protein